VIADVLLDVTKVFGLVIAAGGAATVLWRGYKASRSAFTAEIASELAEQLSPLQATIDEIKSELSYNGGGSVKDMTKANGEQLAEVRMAAAEAAALAKGVALALQASHVRADDVDIDAEPGVAADAASRTD
jgi:arginine exporter protein ArgO